jgi:8-oxo-dGTP diphosphatase
MRFDPAGTAALTFQKAMRERATIICSCDMKILLVARNSSRWALPGGTLRPKESPEDAARRELEEETGVVTRELKYLFLFGGANKRHYVFQASIGEDSTPEPRNEITRCGWFAARQVTTLVTSVPTREIVALMLEGKAGIEMKMGLGTSLMRPPER